jgi:predicted HTH transcriptional regulator
VEFLINNKKISNSKITEMFGITRQAVLKEMNKLIDLGVIELKGSGRGAYYILT